MCDTTGMANPRQVDNVMVEVMNALRPGTAVALHFHDTRAAGMANVLAAMQVGVTTFDASIGGLGGCPFAPGATGNIATEDLVHLLHEMGIETGVDLDKLVPCARLVRELVGHEVPSHILKAGKRCDLFDFAAWRAQHL